MKASAYFTIDELGGKHGVKELKRELDALHGVLSVSVSEKTNSVAVDYDTTGENCERIQKKIQDLGYGVLGVKLDQHMM
jgi:copper chaperone CopZ